MSQRWTKQRRAKFTSTVNAKKRARKANGPEGPVTNGGTQVDPQLNMEAIKREINRMSPEDIRKELNAIQDRQHNGRELTTSVEIAAYLYGWKQGYREGVDELT